MCRPGRSSAHLPSWVASLDAPVWICDFNGRIAYLNDQAKVLLGVEDSRCIGSPCHGVVHGTDASGSAHCRRGCQVLKRFRRGLPNEPNTVWVGGSRSRRSPIKIIPIAVRGRTRLDHRLVHIALETGNDHHDSGFLTRIGARSTNGLLERSSPRRSLTPRERQLLGLLTEDKNLKTIAGELRITYSTARTHVQYILVKLGAHSMLEAIALCLLDPK